MQQPTHHENEHQIQEVSNPISMPQGPITRSRSKKLQQALIYHLQGLVSSAIEGLEGHPSFGVIAN